MVWNFQQKGLGMMIGTKRMGTSERRARLEAYLAVGVGAIGLAASSEAAVVSINLTGKTGDNMGIAPGGFQNFYDILPNN